MIIDRKFIIKAKNPINGKEYTEENSLLLCAKDICIIPALEAYKETAVKVGANKEHIQSIGLLIERVKVYQETVESRVPDTIGLEINGCLFGNVVQYCKIRGTEIGFEKDVPEDQILEVAQDIWDHPSKYSDYKDGSDASFYSFIKYLWITYPDGHEVRLDSIVNMG